MVGLTVSMNFQQFLKFQKFSREHVSGPPPPRLPFPPQKTLVSSELAWPNISYLVPVLEARTPYEKSCTGAGL